MRASLNLYQPQFVPASICANPNLCQPQFVLCGLVDFLAIMVGEGDYVIGSQTFWNLRLLGGPELFRGYRDRRHAHGAVKAPAHMPNLAVLALSSSAM